MGRNLVTLLGRNLVSDQSLPLNDVFRWVNIEPSELIYILPRQARIVFSSVSGKMRHGLGFGVYLAQSDYFIERLDKALKEANMWLRGAKQGSQGGLLWLKGANLEAQ